MHVQVSHNKNAHPSTSPSFSIHLPVYKQPTQCADSLMLFLHQSVLMLNNQLKVHFIWIPLNYLPQKAANVKVTKNIRLTNCGHLQYKHYFTDGVQYMLKVYRATLKDDFAVFPVTADLIFFFKKKNTGGELNKTVME